MMVPFRVYDREKKVTLLVVNYHPNESTYLAAREDDSPLDGELVLIKAEQLRQYRLIGFMDMDD